MTRPLKMRLLRIGALLLLIVLLLLNFNRVIALIGRPFGVSPDLQPGGAVISAKLPPGFRATVYARDLKGPRFMAVGPDGTVYVTEQGGGRVSALPDKNHDGKADERLTVTDGLEGPSSVIFYSNTLIVGEHNKVSQISIGADGKATGHKVLVPDLPNNGSHLTKTVLVGGDGRLYVAIGSTCNVCNESDDRRAAVSSYSIDGTGQRVFAKGLRNAVGLALNPWTQEIWASNNGRDLMGDNTPPETIYQLAEGIDAGWPRCHAGRIIDPDFGSKGCDGVAKPVVEMQAHMAPLGITFYKDGPFPVPYTDSLYVALHGSWNSSDKVGYKVMRVPMKDGQVAGEPEDFMTGFLHDDGIAVDGRPAGVTVAADGSLLVSDDKGGFIYRVAWVGK